MHGSFVIAVAFAATVYARTTVTEPTDGEVATDGAVAEEYTTVDTITTFEIAGHDDAAYNKTSNIHAPRERRIGGTNVTGVNDNDYYYYSPYIVAIYDAENNYICVGTILAPSLILTARQCLEPEPVAHVRAHSRDSYNKGGEKHKVGEPIFYGEGHDIALLPLKTRISPATTVAILEPEIPVPVGASVQALGWGQMGNDEWPRYLMKVDLVVSPVEECWHLYETQDIICTETESSYTCKGDSGGPIMYDGSQVGIISGSKVDKCGSGVPTANVNLKKYAPWIKSHAPEALTAYDDFFDHYYGV